jgi:hypothetical protein
MCNFLIGEHDVNVESVVYEHCVQTDRYELLEVVSACDTMMDLVCEITITAIVKPFCIINIKLIIINLLINLLKAIKQSLAFFSNFLVV